MSEAPPNEPALAKSEPTGVETPSGHAPKDPSSNGGAPKAGAPIAAPANGHPAAPRPPGAPATPGEAQRLHQQAVQLLDRAERMSVTSAATIKKLRKQRLRTLVLRVGLGTVLPTFITALYLAFVASPQYESTAQFTIESREGGSVGGMELLAGGAAVGAALRDTILAREQIASRDMADFLIDGSGFVRHYSDARRDRFFRLGSGASREEIFDYYLDQVDAAFDWQTGVVRIRVRAFTKQDAIRFTEAILDESERRMNDRMERARRDTLAVAEREVERAEQRLEAARATVASIRSDGGELDPRRTAEAAVGVRTQVEMQLASAQAELVALLQNMQPDAPQVVAARQRVSGLISSVSRENHRMVAESQDDLATQLETYEPAVLRKDLAQESYTASVASLERARQSLIQQQRYLVRISGPTRPSEATYPEVLLGSATVFLVTLGIVIIASLMLASVREHANV